MSGGAESGTQKPGRRSMVSDLAEIRPPDRCKIKGLEPTTGIEPVNLFLTKEALYLLSYVGLHP